MSEKELQKIIVELWEIVNRLEKNYFEDGKKFTIDGHLLGSIGEVYAKEKFKLTLYNNSAKTHDAIDEVTKKEYQIKITQRNKVGLRHEPKNLIVIQIDKTGMPNIIYNGNGEPVWNLIKNKKAEQKFISIKQLEKIKANA
ncbi:DUF6998 domain-containing protein [Flavobacterium sp. N1994]|uniref:DUF6998 domain-containing protein n=1 Tax=Flavobacterium sp. N1994 TaxID=2986827 RepID=UPI002221FE07|nr:hypothetical protein [Flavobacterium sp. N1994]